MQASEIISKKVASIYDGKFSGIVEDILINKRSHRLMFLKVYNEQINQYFLLNASNVYSFGKHLILIKNTSYLQLMENLDGIEKQGYNPLNTLVLNLQGKEIGTVCDINFSNNNLVESINVNGYNEQILIKNLLIIGKEISILNTTPPKKILGFAPKKEMPKTLDYKVNIISTIENKTAEPKTEEALNINPNDQPKRIITDYQFLINRKITDNIYMANGELLLRKNSVINSQSITKARLNGKLVELTQKSRK